MRVVAGRLGGRPLKAPAGDATRPTGARVKEALFSILSNVRGARVLDLYAGSGALGIEALSRGAARAVFVEADRPALACLRENLTRLGLDGQTEVLPLRVEAARAKLVARGPFDLVLCDPPWRDVKRARGELEALVAAGALAPHARVALEHSAKFPPSLPNADTVQSGALCTIDQRQWGDTGVTFFSLELGPADVPGTSEA
ncbi:MAG TPA: 16S rRNA (guanine(966)-N(2))-methyltransferase RsmD [Polyangiaceae bacterium]|nr:16S rRNA (guanine(966)-N(2))-methyltransferase RsmD [Polyangiaceae bacterium]